MKFREGDVVYCTRPVLKDTMTQHFCGLGEGMNKACSGFPMEVVEINNGSFPSYRLEAKEFGEWGTWWFHEDDLDFFNLSLENK